MLAAPSHLVSWAQNMLHIMVPFGGVLGLQDELGWWGEEKQGKEGRAVFWETDKANDRRRESQK